MIDATILEELIKAEVKNSVESHVTTMLDDEQWITSLESRIVKHVQDRITARFSNIETVPDLVDTVKSSVESLFTQGHLPGLNEYIEETVIRQTVDNSVQSLIQLTIENLVLDTQWLEKIQTLLNQQMTKEVGSKLSHIDINATIAKQIESNIDGKLRESFSKDFATLGIADRASKRELTILDDVVVAENQLASKNLSVAEDGEINGTLTVNNLILKGVVNVDNSSWNELKENIAQSVINQATDTWKNELVATILDTAKTQGISFDQVLIEGEPLVADGTLNSNIKTSSIEVLGELEKIKVLGTSKFNDTLAVHRGRVGINTDDPEMAFSVWDEEINIITGKLAKQNAFIGTGRLQNLSIGVNRGSHIEINSDGLTTIKQLQIDRFRISHNPDVPGHSGTRGDLVFNSDPKPNTPWGWVCLGGFRWQPLRSA